MQSKQPPVEGRLERLRGKALPGKGLASQRWQGEPRVGGRVEVPVPLRGPQEARAVRLEPLRGPEPVQPQEARGELAVPVELAQPQAVRERVPGPVARSQSG